MLGMFIGGIEMKIKHKCKDCESKAKDWESKAKKYAEKCQCEKEMN
jgi:hypothetical protein